MSCLLYEKDGTCENETRVFQRLYHVQALIDELALGYNYAIFCLALRELRRSSEF